MADGVDEVVMAVGGLVVVSLVGNEATEESVLRVIETARPRAAAMLEIALDARRGLIATTASASPSVGRHVGAWRRGIASDTVPGVRGTARC